MAENENNSENSIAQFKTINLTNDVTFKKIMAEYAVLIPFINTVLAHYLGKNVITKITDFKTEKIADEIGKKNFIMDVWCKDQDGRDYIIEMQIDNLKNTRPRLEVYTASVLGNQQERGAEYDEYTAVITIAIVNGTIFPNQQHYKATHRWVDEKTGEPSFDLSRIVVIDLKKFKAFWEQNNKTVENTTDLEELFCYAFMQEGELPMKMLATLAEKSEVFEKMEETIHRFTRKDITVYKKYQKLLAQERDAMAAKKEEGRVEGRAEGRAEGEKKKTAEMVRRMLAKNKPDEEIMDFTGITAAQLEAIKKGVF